jgi:import inner membrane translocase subunit TIM44
MPVRAATGGAKEPEEEKPSVFGTFMSELKKGVSEQKELKDAADKIEAAAADAKAKASEGYKASSEAYRATASRVSEDESLNEALKSAEDAKASTKKTVSDSANAFMTGARDSLKTATSSGRVKSAQKAMDDVAKTGPAKAIADLASIAHEELLATDHANLKATPYTAPTDRRRSVLEKRHRRKETFVKANEDVSSLVIKKEGKWTKKWNAFVDDNPITTKIEDMKISWEESDNMIARRSREVAESFSDAVGGTFEDTEMGYVYEEVLKRDPKFSEMKFTLHCEKVIFPAILEAYLAGDAEVLEDWCTEACYNTLSSIIEQRKQLGQRLEYKVLDLRSVDIHAARMMDDHPVFVMTFQVTSNMVVRDKQGEIIEGADDEVKKVFYVCAMRRDPEELDPLLAWSAHEFGQIAEAKMLV